MATKLTPLMSQYVEIKQQHRDGILLFQVGDFYETFYQDAREVSRILNIALTTRDKGKEDPIPLAGVPMHAVDSYISKLLQAGKKVIICDQVEKPEESKGVVKREVTDIITPGTVLEPGTLTERENNYVLSLTRKGNRYGFSLLDISTGECWAGEEEQAAASNLLSGYNIREILIPDSGEDPDKNIAGIVEQECTLEKMEPYQFNERVGRESLLRHFDIANLSCFQLEDRPLAVAATGAIVDYAKDLRQNELKHITGVKLLVSDSTLFLDRETLVNLEIFEPLRGSSPRATLLYHLDRTKTAGGGRMLRNWMRHPLRSIESINKRLSAISSLISDQMSLARLRKLLTGTPDMERLLSRITTGKAIPRELISLKNSLAEVPAMGKAVEGLEDPLMSQAREDFLIETGAEELINRSIAEDAPGNLKEGGVIKKGFSSKLDRIIEISEEGKRWIAELEKKERKRTGISTLKVGFNKVFGYYIEVSRTHDNRIPGNYVCKQTLVSSQRYITEELKQKENSIISAENRRVELEREIYEEVLEEIGGDSGKIQVIARAVSLLDTISSFAQIALERNYCRPLINESRDLIIREGRHPVVELISEKSFIPNDTVIKPDDKQILVITGPNMGGKSTYIRQTAIISILAHMGCFVPASQAEVGVMDRIFTRVGSSDNLAMGKSTFMVEMSETARILHNCTDRSLVLLDEVGRGTSTMDGLSLAWAVTEYLLEAEGRRAKTLFATHFHQLTRLADFYPRLQNMNVEVKEYQGSILFLYKIRNGASDQSYGIHVAKLAGLPHRVITRAGEILKTIQREEPGMEGVEKNRYRQESLFREKDELEEVLDGLDIYNTTPMEAMKILEELVEINRRRES